MSSTDKTVYSQGFSFGSFIQKGVDPRTGQYTCSIRVYDTPSQARNCPSLKLCLSYDPLDTNNHGFGKGWSFNLSQYQHRQLKTLQLSTGEHYQVDTTSGFSVKDQKLKSFQFTKSGSDYQVTYKSGEVEILSNSSNTYNASVPINVHAANGRGLSLKYKTSGEEPRLIKIQDGSSDLLQIDYSQTDQVRVLRSPKTLEESDLTFKLKNSQLSEIQLPLDNNPSWKFTYETCGSLLCLTKVTSPTGLIEEISYKNDGHKLPNKAPYTTIPYAISHTARPGFNQPAITTTYSYSDHNFLGYGGGFGDWKSGEDNLYRSKSDYKYTSTVAVDGGPTTAYAYNKYHLITSIDKTQGSKEVTQTFTYYALTDKAFKDQPAQYQLPQSVATSYIDNGSNTSRTETQQYTFDEWGNATQDIQANGIQTDRVYYSADGEIDSSAGDVLCPADPNGFHWYLKTETVTPAASSYSTAVESTYKTYQSLETADGAPVSTCVVPNQIQTLQADQVLSTVTSSYIDSPSSADHGRLSKRISKLSDPYPLTQEWSYTSDDSNLTTTTKTTSFDNLAVTETAVNSLRTGRTQSTTNTESVKTEFDYDTVGRLVKSTVASGTDYEAARSYMYLLPGQGDVTNTQFITTDVKGMQTRDTIDGLGRTCQSERQDDDGTYDDSGAYNGTFRTISTTSYDKIGRLISQDTTDWLRVDGADPQSQTVTQTFDYDDWGNKCKTTSSSGLVTISIHDPIGLTYTAGVNGEGESVFTSNLLDDVIDMKLLYKDGTQYSDVTNGCDGFGRLVETTDNLDRNTKFDQDGFDRVTQTTWGSDSVINTSYTKHTPSVLPVSMITNSMTMGEQAFDGLDRMTSDKIGGRTTTYTYSTTAATKPATITTPKGDQLQMSYEPDLGDALVSCTDTDDTDTYQYDAKAGVITLLKNGSATRSFTYLPSGLLSQNSLQVSGSSHALTADSTYSMNGKLQSYTDVHGQKTTIQYNSFGKAQTVTQGNITVTLSYDTATRLSKSVVNDSANNKSVTTQLAYDDFGREISRTVQNGNSTAYSLSQTYSSVGLASARKMLNGSGNALRSETFGYDNLNRLVDYQCMGEKSPADQYGNKIKRQQFVFDQYDNFTTVTTTFQQDGTTNVATYTYSSTDPTQLTGISNTHSDYASSIALTYDENGCLTQDELGRTLAYDTWGRLTSLTGTDGKMVSGYQYDASGKLICQTASDGTKTYFYYRGGSLIAAKIGDDKYSYLSDGAAHWAQNGPSGKTRLWASDAHDSITMCLSSDSSDPSYQAYTPYGYSAIPDYLPGFDGSWQDPVTGWYHLGNGTRVYNPILCRFHSSDTWGPFVTGEINSYAYCLGDPINRSDPGGHFSIFGMEFGVRDLVVMGVGISVGIALGLLTGGTGFAVEAGLVGVASDVATGAVYDLATGKTPTVGSMGTDALYGALGAVGGELIGRGLAKGFKALDRTVNQLLEGGEKLRHAGPKPKWKAGKGENPNERSISRGIRDQEAGTSSNRGGEPAGEDRWTYREEKPRKKLYTPSFESQIKLQEEYEAFYDRGLERGWHPKANAEMIGRDVNYEMLRGKYSVHNGNPAGTFRLSGRHRVAFTANDKTKDFVVFQVGDHYPPSKKFRVPDKKKGTGEVKGSLTYKGLAKEECVRVPFRVISTTR